MSSGQAHLFDELVERLMYLGSVEQVHRVVDSIAGLDAAGLRRAMERRIEQLTQEGRDDERELLEFVRSALQDVLALGSDARMNTPSRNDGNWGWRYDPGALNGPIASRLEELTAMCDRLPPSSAANQQSHGKMAEDFAA